MGSQPTAEFTLSAQDLHLIVNTFEEAMRQRIRTSNRVDALARYRRCADCGHEFMPKQLEPCPVCESMDSRMESGKRTCKSCNHKWEPSMDLCPKCDSSESDPAPRRNQILEKTLESQRTTEQALRKNVEKVVHMHPIWGWAKDVKGLGAVTLGRLLSRIDITKTTTVTKFWTHCGFGLEMIDSKMVPQRKRKGQTVTYNPQLRSACYLMADSLIKAADAYHAWYKTEKVRQAKREDVLTPIHAHNAAKRHMTKLALSHIWQVWREAEGLPVPAPYAFSILKHSEEHWIQPDEMRAT